jgi:uncharacterized protein
MKKMIKKNPMPTITQAEIIYLFLIVATITSSIILIPILGSGANLWINEILYIFLPVMLLSRYSGWSVEQVYRYRTTSRKNKIISFFVGPCIWFFAVDISKTISNILDHLAGKIIVGNNQGINQNQIILLLLGTVILAPICEETLFRGFIQRAYESHNKNYSYIVSAVLFGMLHILNGISDVLPTIILGLALGYLVYKTNSLMTSMIAHMTINASALFIYGALGIANMKSVPFWLHGLGGVGLLLSIFLLSRLEPGEEVSLDIGSEKIGIYKYITLFLLITSFIILALVGVLEILRRLRYH